jgi:hypothetical protein
LCIGLRGKRQTRQIARALTHPAGGADAVGKTPARSIVSQH